MEGIQETTACPMVAGLEGPSIALEIDLSVSELEAVFRACYKLTGRCYVFLARGEGDSRFLTVALTAKTSDTVLGGLAGEALQRTHRPADPKVDFPRGGGSPGDDRGGSLRRGQPARSRKR